MPRNDYECPKHGVREIFFVSEPPKVCPLCGEPVRFVVAQNQFGLYGEMAWLDEPSRRSIEMQLGVYPESPSHLRQIEKAKGVTRTTKTEKKRQAL